MRTTLFRAAVVLAALTAGCQANTGATPEPLPCNGHSCAVSIQNDGPGYLAMSWADSTGRTAVLGLVNPMSIRVFRVQWARSATVRLIALVDQKEQYFVDQRLEGYRPNELHFPQDFNTVDDAFSSPRKP